MNIAEQTMTHYRCLYKNHGNSIGMWCGWVTDLGVIVMEHSKTLTGKRVVQKHPVTGKNIGRSNETTVLEQALLELDSRTRLKIDKGYVLTVDEAKSPATNALGLSRPMLATAIEKIKIVNIDWDSAFVQPKLDGHRALYKDGVLYSRQGKELHLPHINLAIEQSGLGHLHLDGELYLHGYTLQEVSKIIKGDEETSRHIEYHIYDHISDRPFSNRTVGLAGTFNDGAINIRIRYVETCIVRDMDELTEHHQRYRNAGYEGTMLRFGDGPYETNKRSRTLLKLKEFQDAEYKVIGCNEGLPYIKEEATYRVPVWICATPSGSTFTVTAAGTMQEKDDQWQNKQDYIGKSLTVKFHYLSKDGIPQLPIALRFQQIL